MSAGELARRTGLTTGATTRLIDRLENAGLVRRVRATDRRQVIVELSGERLPEIDHAIEPAQRRLLEVFQGFDANEIQTIFTYFAKATTALVAAVEELSARPGD
jgi:DNA-binding MarR family transcriptional regulator